MHGGLSKGLTGTYLPLGSTLQHRETEIGNNKCENLPLGPEVNLGDLLLVNPLWYNFVIEGNNK